MSALLTVFVTLKLFITKPPDMPTTPLPFVPDWLEPLKEKAALEILALVSTSKLILELLSPLPLYEPDICFISKA